MQQLNTQSFQYEFNLSDVIPHAHVYEEATRIQAETYITDVIYESFVVTADQDYLTARLLALKGLPRGFFWGASQATEKYLKAFLLLKGISVKELSNSHQILKIYDHAQAIDARLSTVDTEPHPSIKNTTGSTAALQKFKVRKLLTEIDTHGAARNRYNAAGLDYNTGHLLAFDTFVHQLRSLLGVPDISESYKRLSHDLTDSFHLANP
ncbi:MAG: hypothetical protein RR855_01590 [Comamonas sp.]